MRRFIGCLLLILLVVMPVLAEELYDYGGLTLSLSLEDTLTILRDGAKPRVEDVTAELSWFPRASYRQEVLSLTTKPPAEFTPPTYTFHWKRPPVGELTFGLEATVRTSSEPLGVTEKVPFPIKSLPSDIAKYTHETELIDINDAIRAQALMLAAGKDDLFEVVYALADWVTTNIHYNLTTLTAEATQPSTWVMEMRQGVCDELTGLFISMLRSLGIPARFVSGLSYTNLPEFSDPWGGHGWAEVYFPGTGWVPFDVTYGTYGFVDATHIKLQDSLDSRTRSLDFLMRGYAVTLKTASLKTAVEVLDKEQAGTRHYSVTLEPYDDRIGLDSYNLITATVTNNVPAYLSLRLTLAQTKDLELLSSPERNILLHPREKLAVHWLVKTEDLKKHFIYRFPVRLYAGQQVVGETEFSVRDGYQEYDRAFFDRFLEQGTAPPLYDDVEFSCVTEGERRYVGGSLTVTCTLTNTGSKDLGGVTLCLSRCSDALQLPAGAETTISERLTCDTPGAKAVLATASNKLMHTNALVRYECFDEARVAITNLTVPDALRYDEEGTISFRLERVSENIPQDLVVSITHDNFAQEWSLDELDQAHIFSLSFKGANLDPSGNEFVVRVSYADPLGKTYEVSEERSVQLRDLTLFQRISLWLLNLQRLL
ncbi:hypothetical protein D6789_03180 [Candidatus Woesearchaeota archaeon]|nr:MAG: hypothetical protein D6789_03180 [Candidatus Woesearchaeota archaeon]